MQITSRLIAVFYFIGHLSSPCFAQKELDQVIIERIVNSNAYKTHYLTLTCTQNHKVERINLIFDTLPIVEYDLSKATFVADEIVKKDYAVPNCTNSEQNFVENFELTTSLKTSATIEHSEGETDKITTGFKAGIKVSDIGMDFSMSEEYGTSMTLRRQTSTETSRTYKEAKTLNFKIPPETYRIVRLQSKKGILRVPFKAHFVISGTFVFSYDRTCRTSVMFPNACNGHCEVVVPIKWFLSKEQCTFNFDGYIASENSSDFQVLYDERKVDKRKDCIFQDSISTLANNPAPSKTPKSKLNKPKTSVWPSKVISDAGSAYLRAEIVNLNAIEEKNYTFKKLNN